MTLAGLLIFAAAYAMAVASPGPGIAAIVARALGNGLSGLAPFILGFILGDLTLFWVAAFGLAAIAQAHAGVLIVIKYAGALYLLYLAYKLWTAPVAVAEAGAPRASERGWRLFLTSYSLTVGNPKPIVFFMALLPTIVDLERLDLMGVLEITAVIVLVITPILAAYAIAAARARALFRSPHAIRALNRGTGTMMAAAAAAVAISR
ncbi:MAG: LysE family translocator [Hyphomicrobiaceae bacterium]